MKKWVLIISLLVAPLLSYGGPPEIVTKLMKQEVSLFSFGMYLLDNTIKRWAPDEWFGSASFDYDTGTITIRAFALKDSCKSENECLNKIKEKLVDVDNILCYREPDNKTARCDIDHLAQYFTPIGYSIANFHNGRTSEAASLEVSRHVELQFSLFRTGLGNFSCTRKHLSKDVFCRKH
jgi:hypothetical protein